jgi:hypothetical protein
MPNFLLREALLTEHHNLTVAGRRDPDPFRGLLDI